MHQPRFEALRMLRAQTEAIDNRCSDNEWHIYLAAKKVAHFRGLIYEGIGREGDEVDELDFDDRGHSRQGESYSETSSGRLAKRTIVDAIRTKLFEEALVDSEGPAVSADVLPEQDN